MDNTQIAKVQRFLADKVMSETVREFMEAECLKPSKDRDVQNLAARFMAIEILRDAWKELSKYKLDMEEKTARTGQVGL